MNNAPVPIILPLNQHNSTLIIFTKEFEKQFAELVFRGSNLWPDASPEMKTFCDLVTNGKQLQAYFKQANQQPQGEFQ